MRKSYGFLIFIALLAAFVLFLFGLTTIERNDTETDAETTVLEPLDQPTVSFGNPSIGPKDARITIVEFGDLQCEACADLAPTLKKIIAEYPMDVRLVWKDVPIESLHPNAMLAAKAARCADEQGAFWEMQEQILTHRESVSKDMLALMAGTVGIDSEIFSDCLESERPGPFIERDLLEATRLGINSVPYLFVNGQKISGAISYEGLRVIIDEELARTQSTP